ncbi:MAG: hypothetical protein AAF184_10450 [Pseudomonadota bacterium]
MSEHSDDSVPQDGAPALDEAAKSVAAADADTGTETKEPPKWQAPRSWWIDFLVLFLTFGAYFPFWLYARAREMGALGREPRRAILWFLMPIGGPLVYAIAVPRFMEPYADLGREHGVDGRDNVRGFIVFWMFVASIGAAVSSRIELPMWMYVAIVAAIAAGATGMSAVVNGTKRALPEGLVRWRRKKSGLGVFEWLTVPIGLVFWLGLGLAILTGANSTPLVAGSTYEDPEGRFAIPITDGNWSLVQQGFLADEEAEVEFAGPALTSLYVFDYSGELSVDEVIDYHVQNAHDYALTSVRECEETRRIAKDEVSVIATVVCEGRSMGDPWVLVASVIGGEGQVLEFYAETTAAKISFPTLRDNLVALVSGWDRP